VIEEMIGGQHRMMNGHRLSELGEHELDSEPEDGNHPSNNKAHPRHRMGVLSEVETKTQSGKNKIKTLLTRPASLEMAH
jgi:hypothetical protein